MKNIIATERVATTNNPNNRPPKRGFGITLIPVAIAFAILSYAVFPHVALYNGLITSDQYVTITTTFFEYGWKVIENGTSIIPSIIPAR